MQRKSDFVYISRTLRKRDNEGIKTAFNQFISEAEVSWDKVCMELRKSARPHPGRDTLRQMTLDAEQNHMAQVALEEKLRATEDRLAQLVANEEERCARAERETEEARLF